jgi:hypothetical protein
MNSAELELNPQKSQVPISKIRGGENLTTFSTEIQLRQFYREMKRPLVFDNFQDF